MSLVLTQGAALPPWSSSITVDGETVDFSDGWTFELVLNRQGATETPDALITGAAAGEITVEWPADGLDIDVGDWLAALTAVRNDGRRLEVIYEQIQIRPAP